MAAVVCAAVRPVMASRPILRRVRVFDTQGLSRHSSGAHRKLNVPPTIDYTKHATTNDQPDVRIPDISGGCLRYVLICRPGGAFILPLFFLQGKQTLTCARSSSSLPWIHGITRNDRRTLDNAEDVRISACYRQGWLPDLGQSHFNYGLNINQLRREDIRTFCSLQQYLRLFSNSISKKTSAHCFLSARKQTKERTPTRYETK